MQCALLHSWESTSWVPRLKEEISQMTMMKAVYLHQGCQQVEGVISPTHWGENYKNHNVDIDYNPLPGLSQQ